MPNHLAYILVVLLLCPARAIDNGKGITPPMGWRSWNLYGGNVDQELMQRVEAKHIPKECTQQSEYHGKPTRPPAARAEAA